MIRVRVNQAEFTAALRHLARVTKTAIPDIVNQAGLDITGRSFDNIPPHGDGNAVQDKRSAVRALLTEPLSTQIKLFKSGKRKGQFGRRGARRKQLQRVHLISNYWRGKSGKTGLYGEAMTKYAGKVKQSRQVGVGFLKSVFLPIIRALNPVVKYKFPFAKTSRISRWPGSRGNGIATLAKPGWRSRCILNINVDVKASQESKVSGLYQKAISEAFSWKTGKLLREIERRLQPEFNRISARRL